MPKTFLVSDESVNSYNCRVLSGGGDTSAFMSNPVMLWMHLRGKVVGRWENLRLENGKWYADPVIDDQDGDLGQELAGKVERGFIKAASIGLVVLEAFYNEDLNCYDITKWVLQEISLVDIGSNQNALQLYAELGGEPIDHLQLSAHLEQFKATPTNQSIPDDSMKTIALATIALALGLTENATEQDVVNLAAKLAGDAPELANLRLKLKANQDSEANTLLDQAVLDKRISATAKPIYLKLFAADHEGAKEALASLAKPTNLNEFTQNGQNTQQVSLSAQDADTYDKMDKAGTLMQLAQSDKPQFDRLYEAKFGKKPDKLTV